MFAGTVVEEGEITIRVKEVEGNNRFDQIVTMIEESEKLKSELEGKAEHYADKLVPWTLGATGLTYLLTRNVTKAMSILMVDFCCALKLAMPISVLSAIREASLYNVTVKGGKFLEAVAEADTIVFDKTGTLTKAHPTVVDVVNFNDEYSSDDMLRVAACLEEHFPHSMAKAVVDAASKKGFPTRKCIQRWSILWLMELQPPSMASVLLSEAIILSLRMKNVLFLQERSHCLSRFRCIILTCIWLLRVSFRQLSV